MKKRNIWILVITVWTIYFTINMGFKLGAGYTSLIWITGAFITSLSGFIVTYLLFIYYRIKSVEELQLINIFILVVISSVLSVILWLILDHLMSIPLWGFDVIILIVKGLWVPDSILIFFIHFLIFFSISAIFWGWHLINNLINQKVKTEKAILLSENTRLKLLGLQLNPHFLFNALSSLRSLIREDQKLAERMLTKISEFLRYSLVINKDTQLPLSEELESIKNYIEIEKVRYGENLVTDFKIDPLSEDYPVLRFLLHPIVENAVKYGMDTSPMPLKIELVSEVLDNKLIIKIINTGKWIENNIEERKNGTGTGIKNVRERLEHLYPESHKIQIEESDGNVTIIIELNNRTIKNHENEI